MKTAFITGITGQDGAYLAEFLLEKRDLNIPDISGILDQITKVEDIIIVLLLTSFLFLKGLSTNLQDKTERTATRER